MDKDLIDLIKAAISIPGVITVVFIGGKWLLSDYFKKRTELEELKKALKDRERDDLQKQIDKFQEKVETLEAVVSNHRAALASHSNELKRSELHSQEITKALDSYAAKTSNTVNEFARLTHERLKIVEKAIKTETVDLGHGKVLIKNKT